MKYTNFNLKCIDVQGFEDISASLYSYSIEGEHTGEVKRLHYQGWSDFSGIDKEKLDRLVKIILDHQKDPESLVIAHCRAGVGRSGTVIVACSMQRKIDLGLVNESNLQEILGRRILKGRRRRGPGFVQSGEQLRVLVEWSWMALQRHLNMQEQRGS